MLNQAARRHLGIVSGLLSRCKHNAHTRESDSAVSERLPSRHTPVTDVWHNGHMTPTSPTEWRTLPPTEAKSSLRSAVRRNRLQRGERRNNEHAETFRDLVLALPESDGITSASVYVSRPHEPGTLRLLEALTARGVEVIVPQLGEGLQRGWAVYTSTDDLVERSPGRPPEPSGEFLPQERIADAQLIVVPALAADTLGTRLGQGAGWYDRALADATPGVPIVALVFDDEFYDAEERALPRQHHDVSVDIVVTPSRVVRIAP